jgi:hypothetical protein
MDLDRARQVCQPTALAVVELQYSNMTEAFNARDKQEAKVLYCEF